MKKLVLFALLFLITGVINFSQSMQEIDIPPKERIKELNKELGNISSDASALAYESEKLRKTGLLLSKDLVEKMNKDQFGSVALKLERIAAKLEDVHSELEDLEKSMNTKS
jgi:archaellum component FlaC